MAQISRPFQIALGALVLVALVWMFALRAHEPNPTQVAHTSASAPRTVSKSARDAAARREATRRRALATHKTAIATHKTATHTTVAVTHKSATSSGKTVVVAHRTPARPHESASVSHKTVVPSTGHAVSRSSVHADRTAARRHARPAGQHPRPAGQIAVEAELAQGKTVMLVFWNPHSSVDREVNSQARALVSGSKGTVAMHAALANQVNLFGSITEVVRVYQTPTILIVNRHGVVSTLTGLTEVFALQQAVREAQHASR